MKKYRKLPVVIEAVQIMDSTFDALHPNPEHIRSVDGCKVVYVQHKRIVEIETLEGIMTAQIGDWIIRGVNGELYPCKPDIFEKTYEPIENDEAVT